MKKAAGYAFAVLSLLLLLVIVLLSLRTLKGNRELLGLIDSTAGRYERKLALLSDEIDRLSEQTDGLAERLEGSLAAAGRQISSNREGAGVRELRLRIDAAARENEQRIAFLEEGIDRLSERMADVSERIDGNAEAVSREIASVRESVRGEASRLKLGMVQSLSPLQAELARLSEQVERFGQAPPLQETAVAPASAETLLNEQPRTPPRRADLDLEIQKDIQQGLLLYRGGRYDAAAACFAEVLAQQPENPQARQYYAVSLFRANPGASDNYPLIEQHLHSVLRGQPNNVVVLEFLGRLAAEREQWNDALGWFRQVIAVQPDNAALLKMAGLCSLYGGDSAAARQYFERGCSLESKDAELWYYRGIACEAEGDPEAAVAAFIECVKTDAGYTTARLKAGLILRDLGRYEEAGEQLAACVAERPGFEALEALGDCRFAEGELEAAEELWRRSLSLLGRGTAAEKRRAAGMYVKLSRSAWQRGAVERSLAHAREGMLCEPLPILKAYQGRGYLATGRSSRGTAMLREVIDAYPGSEAAGVAAQALEEANR